MDMTSKDIDTTVKGVELETPFIKAGVTIFTDIDVVQVQFLIFTKINNKHNTRRFTFVLAFPKPIFRIILRCG